MTLRVGLVGAGAMGRNHARVLSTLDGVDLVGIADPLLDGSLFGAAVVENAEALIATGIDYAVVACPTELHELVGLLFADAGVHALIEKPLAADVPGAERLTRAFEDKNLIGGVGHIERYNPAVQGLRSRLANGDLGDIYQVLTRRQGPFPGRIADVGVVKDLAPHDIDLTAWVTGESYTSVTAHTIIKSGRPFEDMVSAIALLSGGTMANHVVNWLSPFKERSTVVIGERGCFVADTLTGDLTFFANGQITNEWEAMRSFRGVSEGDSTKFAMARREPLLVEHENFRDAVLGVGNDIVTFEQGLQTVRVAAAMLDSAAAGASVEIGP